MNENKVLKPYTIIPPNLYVQRKADKQVRNIIHDMGRPGYVLVSRQMGKTNLLLNAKRNFQNDRNAFVYVDLSNSFLTAKTCFENIVDTAIDSYEELFRDAAKSIASKRKQGVDAPAHKQHTDELRMLLNCLNGGKMVIMLDEIDALTRTDYSDEIFSQIRSTYFAARVNSPVFNNLTYLLSGVVEPSEIIKDQKISPFNIGQKIYLNDFTRSEFDEFISKANLSLREDVLDEIYKWTNGNPRITWDLCSEVENCLLGDEEVTLDVVNDIVKRSYLTTFDKPPIDNIRDLVKGDKEIRSALIEIGYGKSNSINDRIKNKLYLAGIVDYSQDSVEIKNEILKSSLNSSWLRSIEEEEKGLLKIALEYFDKGEYENTLETYEKYLIDNSFSDQDWSISYYHMGYSAYRCSKYESSLEYLNNTKFSEQDSGKLYYLTYWLKGLVHYRNNDVEESLKCLKIVINSGRDDELFARALLNYGTYSLRLFGIGNHRDEAVNIFTEIIEEKSIDTGRLSGDLIQELKVISNFNLGEIHKYEENAELAIQHYKLAYQGASEFSKPRIGLALLSLLESEEDKSKIQDELFELIASKRIDTAKHSVDNPFTFSKNEFRQLLVRAYTMASKELYDKLKALYCDESEADLVEEIYQEAISNKLSPNLESVRVLNQLIKEHDQEIQLLTESFIYKCYRARAFFSSAKESVKYHEEFFELFRERKDKEEIEIVDVELAGMLIFRLTQQESYSKALEYYNLIDNHRHLLPEELSQNFLLIDHLALNLFWYEQNMVLALEKARSILLSLNFKGTEGLRSSLLGKGGVRIVKQNAEVTIKRIYQAVPFLKPAQNFDYGRNDLVKVKYLNDIVTQKKYKQLSIDLELGLCSLVK